MKFNSLLKLAVMASCAAGSPMKKSAAQITDADILQFALTLEHLENTFYKTALTSIPEQEFVQAYGAKYYEDFKRIALDEQEHVRTLTAGLTAAGAKPVAACKYNFPINSLRDVISLSSILEGVGTSAYLGAAPSVMSKDYLKIAGSILVTEALHTSLQRATLGLPPAAGPLGTPILPNGAYSLASAFITSCPSSNGPLPFKAFPKLTAASKEIATAGVAKGFATESAVPAGSYLTFVSGLNTVSVPMTSQGAASAAPVPAGVYGQTYVFVTKGNVTAITDSNVVAGPAIIEVNPEPAQLDLTLL